MVIRCINRRNYALTVDRQYTVLEETRDLFVLLNDNNARVRYSKELFEVVPEDMQVVQEPVRRGNRIQAVAAAPVVPIAPPEPVLTPRTNQDIINSIVISTKYDENVNDVASFMYAVGNEDDNDTIMEVDIKVDFRKYVENAPVLKTVHINTRLLGTYISCGIGQMYNITDFGRVKNLVDYQEDDYDGVLEAIYEKLKSKLAEDFRPRIEFVLASTTTNCVNTIETLKAIGFVSNGVGVNPNSNNEIELLTLKV